jgi:hypothetical protein
MSPLGRVRNLWRVTTGRTAVIAGAQRRAKNSPIQGMASEMGTVAAVLTLRDCINFMRRYEMDLRFRPMYNRAVHDANYYTVRYDLVIPMIHVYQYNATYGVTKFYKDVFEVEFCAEPEMEMEVSAHGKDSYKWDWSLDNLAVGIFSSLKDQISIGRLKKNKLRAAVKTIIQPWEDEDMRAYLQLKYPLLNVPDLDPQIDGFLRKIKEMTREYEASAA